jgi:hypothetical protein
MRLGAILLANYAEAHTGALTIVGGGWDTIDVTAPVTMPEQNGPAPVAVMQGTLAVRVMLSPEEVGRRHPFAIRLLDIDDVEVARIDGDLGAERPPGYPASWDQGVNMAFPLNGLGLPNFGLYRFVFEVDGEQLGDARLQVIKRY